MPPPEQQMAQSPPPVAPASAAGTAPSWAARAASIAAARGLDPNDVMPPPPRVKRRAHRPFSGTESAETSLIQASAAKDGTARSALQGRLRRSPGRAPRRSWRPLPASADIHDLWQSRLPGPASVFDDLQAQLAANRSVFYRALPSGPFYGFNRPGARSSEAIIENWWRQGMMGGAKAHYDGIVAFSQTDFT